MSTNPFKNALIAAGYISILATLLFNMSNHVSDNELGAMAPVFFLSLLTLSAALMGYLFFYQPVRLIAENKPQEAATFLLSTILSFALVTSLIILGWFLLGRVL